MNGAIILELLVSVLLASLGGIVKRLVESEKCRKRKPRSYFLIGAVISMFVGGVIWLLCKSLGLAEFPTALMSAIGGYAGSPMLDKIQNGMEKKAADYVGIKLEDKEEKNEK